MRASNWNSMRPNQTRPDANIYQQPTPWTGIGSEHFILTFDGGFEMLPMVALRCFGASMQKHFLVESVSPSSPGPLDQPRHG